MSSFTQLLIHITGKPVQPEDLRKIESIVNKQIKDELGVYALEIKLEDAKRINGLRLVLLCLWSDLNYICSGRI